MEVHKHPISLILRLGTHSPSTRRPIVALPRALNGTCVWACSCSWQELKWKQATGGSNPSQALHRTGISSNPTLPLPSVCSGPTNSNRGASNRRSRPASWPFFFFVLLSLISQFALQIPMPLCLLRVGVCSVHYLFQEFLVHDAYCQISHRDQNSLTAAHTDKLVLYRHLLP
nr:hypothetical protein B21J21.170 [imported] - Neurospora crassa [Neurospora crassa]